MKHTFITTLCLMVCVFSVSGQFRTSYPHIPRIDVHSHIGTDLTGIANCLDLRNTMLADNDINLAIWINLGGAKDPVENPENILAASKGHMMSAIADYSAHDGLQYPPDALEGFQKQGFIGYKIWAGPWYRKLDKKEDGFPYIDNPVHDATFSEMERLGLLLASIHIADPNGPWEERTDWLADPVEYWKEINAWRHVLEKHPDLIVVVAHGNWLLCQDAQIDYLRNLLATFPNLHIDLAATFQYYHLVNRDNLRSFMIEWSDRILFGTDIGKWLDKGESDHRAEQYIRAFRILETGETVNGGFFGGPDIRGLELPAEVLEKIYYKNAMRLYPQLSENLAKLDGMIK